ncbi:MAG TPA: glutaredoxin 3 [Gammaproteobacteria bacterium]|nr:glutaredoxin 3 [Gammaproteobacteria bacterium]
MTGSAKVTVYTSAFCPYCIWAKRLLAEKPNIELNEIRIDQEPAQADIMVERSGGRMTVPQIFIGELHIGGYDDMAALDRDGRLDPILKESAEADG